MTRAGKPPKPAGLYLPIVGVMCGKEGTSESAAALGEAIARRGWNLLTGGGKGSMRAVTAAYNAVRSKRCLSIAVRPAGRKNSAGADLLIDSGSKGTRFVDGFLSGDSRNHLNVRLADLVVALPGGPGTQSELALAVRHGKPCIALLAGADERIGSLEREGNGFRGLAAPIARTLEEVERFFDEHAPRPIEPVPEGQ